MSRYLILKNATYVTDDVSLSLSVGDIWVDKVSGTIVNPCSVIVGDGDDVIDVGEKLVLPGFTDGHMHLSLWLQKQDHVDLSDCDTADKVIHRISEKCISHCSESALNSVIVGCCWVPEPGFQLHSTLPCRTILDNISSTVPIVIIARDFHSAWLNSIALKMMDWLLNSSSHGHDAAIDTPTSSDVIRDPLTDLATGIVQEHAVFELSCLIDRAPRVSQQRSVEASVYFWRRGITDIVTFEDALGISQIMKHRLDLGVDIRYWVFEKELLLMEAKTFYPPQTMDSGTDLLTEFMGIKLFCDGSLGSETAWISKPYSNSAINHGRCTLTEDQLVAVMTRCSNPLLFKTFLSRSGPLPVAVHAIGDAASSAVVLGLHRGLAEMSARGIVETVPNQIEHFELSSNETLESLSKLSVVVSMQPCHLFHDTDSAHRKWGSDLMALGFPVKSVLQKGIKLRFGSDAPVEIVEPLRNIAACDHIWNEQERVERLVSLKCSTYHGSLVLLPSMPANIVVWPMSLLTAKATIHDGKGCKSSADSQSLLAIHPLVTIKNGKIVWRYTSSVL